MKKTFRKSVSLLLCAILTATSLFIPATVSYASENNAEYRMFVYEMDTNGEYGEAVITSYEGETGCIVNADTNALLKEGFSIDEEKSILSAEVVADGSAVLTVYLMRNRYILSLDYNGGEYGSNYEGIEKEYYYGESISPIDLPCKTGCDFCGWIDEKGNLIEHLPETMPCSDLILTAAWEYVLYRVYFNANGGCFEYGGDVMEYTYEYGAAVELCEAPVRTGYTFEGWSTDSSALLPEFGYDYFENTLHMPCEDIVLYAVWSVNCWTASWVVDGEEYMRTAHDYDRMIEAPYEHPRKAGYYFVGWQDENGDIYSDYYLYPMPARDVVFTAVFEAAVQECRVEFYFESLDGVYVLDEIRTKTISALTDMEITYEAEEITGFTLDTERSIITARVSGDGTTTLQFYYRRNIYRLHFAAQGGYFDDEGETLIVCDVPYGAPLPTVTDPRRYGYVFCGWSGYTEVMPAQDVVLRAQWTPMEFYTEWYANGESFCKTASKYGERIETPYSCPTKVGYIFLGWAETEDSCTVVDVEAMSMPANDMAFYAVFVPCEDTVYAVETYLMNIDGEYEYYTTKFYSGVSDDCVRIEPMTYCGFTFDPYHSVTEGVINPDGSLVLMLFYDRNLYTLNLCVDGNIYSENYYFESVIEELEMPEREGCVFEYWVDENGERVEFPYVMPDREVTLTAAWTLCQYTVCYDANGGCFPDGYHERIEVYDYGTPVYPMETPEKEGYTFKCWVDAYTGEEMGYPFYMPACEITLRAEWVVNMYTVRFYDGSGSLYNAYDVGYGEDISYLLYDMPCPEKYGYTFMGWSMIPDSACPDMIDSYMPCRDLDLFAVWSVNNYRIHWITDDGDHFETEHCFDSPVEPLCVTSEKAGYEFMGWVYPDGTWVEFPLRMPAEDITLTAVFRARSDTTYTVEVYKMNADGSYDKQTEVHIGVTDTEVCADIFRWLDPGFCYNSERSRDRGVICGDGSLVLELYFDRMQYSITYEMNCPDYSNITQEYLYGEVIAVPVYPCREGYVFDGWTPELPTTMPAQDIILTAVWRPMVFTVNWISEGNIVEQREYRYGETIEIPYITFERPGYVFVGWDSYVPATMPAYDLSFTAVWEFIGPIKYKIETYIMNTAGAYDMTAAYHNVQNIEEITVEPVVPEGFVLNEETSVLSGYTDVYDELVLKVYFDRVPYKFTRIIDGKTHTDEYLYGSVIAEPAVPVKDGFVFIGWDAQIPQTMPANDVTVTANFRKITPEDNVDHAISLCITPLKGVTLNYGETITLYAFTKNLPEGYKIKWSVDTSNVTISPSSNGKTCTVTASSSGGAAITAWVVDENGQKVKDNNGEIIKDTEILYSEVNAWLVIVNFFRRLFKIDF